MTELTETNENNNSYDETKCPLCKQLYNEDNRIPRILLNCGHTICSNCISFCINNSSILKCPEDLTEYPNISSLSTFPMNKALIKLLHKISENIKIIEEKNNLNSKVINNFPIPSPISSPNKGLNTARVNRQNLESLKLISSLNSSKKSSICNEHPKKKLEMICLEDVCKICTNCAIFGKHKNHNVLDIDEFIKDIECKAKKLVELFENINQGSIKKEFDIINDNSKNKLSNLLDLINEKYNCMEKVIHEFTQNLIEKVKKDENILLNEISSQFEKLKGRIKYYLELPNKISNNINEWKIKVQDKMNILNDVKDLSDECLKFVDCYGENLFNKLIKCGNSIASDVQKISSFPTDEIQEEIKILNLTIEKQILNQEFFHINKKLDFGDLCEKYEIPKKSEERDNSSKNNMKKLKKEIKEVSNFDEKENIDLNRMYQNENINLEGELNNKNLNKEKVNNINILKQLNNITIDSENDAKPHTNDKSSDDKSNIFLQKEIELENIQFGDDSFLFTDLDSFGLNFEIKGNQSKRHNSKNINSSNNQNKISQVFPLNLNANKLRKNINTLKGRKSLDNLNLNSHKKNNTTYDRDSIDTCIKSIPNTQKQVIKKTKSHVDFSKKSPFKNKSKSKSKHKLSQKVSKDIKSLRVLSPFGLNSSDFNDLFKKNDKINLSRKQLTQDIVINLAKQIKKNKEKIKEIKLIKCGITDDGASQLLKSMEICPKLTTINLANNSLSDKIINDIISLLNKSNSIYSCYFTNNNFSITSKEKIKSYNKNGKIKIFV